MISHEAWAAHAQSADETLFQPMAGSFGEYMAFVQGHMGEPKQAVNICLAKNMAGIMSTFAGEILLNAKIHPPIQIGKLDNGAHERIHAAMRDVLTRACEAGGRTSEVDLYGNAGRYHAMSERKHIDEPCPLCVSPLAKDPSEGSSPSARSARLVAANSAPSSPQTTLRYSSAQSVYARRNSLAPLRLLFPKNLRIFRIKKNDGVLVRRRYILTPMKVLCPLSFKKVVAGGPRPRRHGFVRSSPLPDA